MAETLSLMEFLQALLTDAELRDAFAHDAQGTLSVHGLADLTPDDVHDALVLVQDNQTVDYLDLSGAPTPPPPPTAGDGHEAAVEYLARYLAGPQQTAADEPWPGLDPDTIRPAAMDAPADLPTGSSGADFDDEFGAGTTGPAASGTVDHLAEPIDVADQNPTSAPAAADLDRRVGHDAPGELDGLDVFDGLDEHTAIDDDVADADPGTAPA